MKFRIKLLIEKFISLKGILLLYFMIMTPIKNWPLVESGTFLMILIGFRSFEKKIGTTTTSITTTNETI